MRQNQICGKSAVVFQWVNLVLMIKKKIKHIYCSIFDLDTFILPLVWNEMIIGNQHNLWKSGKVTVHSHGGQGEGNSCLSPFRRECANYGNCELNPSWTHYPKTISWGWRPGTFCTYHLILLFSFLIYTRYDTQISIRTILYFKVCT